MADTRTLVNERRKANPRTHCRNGHEFTPENTIARIIGKYKTKYCKRCEHEYRTSPGYKAKRRKSHDQLPVCL